MSRKKPFENYLTILVIAFFPFFAPHISFSESVEKLCDCLDNAIERIIYIQSLPELEYLNTLDGKAVGLNEFYAKCHRMHPKCCLFSKFYYWQNEIKEIVSVTTNGPIKQKIRCYYNCLTTYCSKNSDPRKTHGDVAEFYDSKDNFMGLSVYMGDGKYCTLSYGGYEK